MEMQELEKLGILNLHTCSQKRRRVVAERLAKSGFQAIRRHRARLEDFSGIQYSVCHIGGAAASISCE
ncbi:MAG: hypothetical protein IJL17_10430 [Kiritimatiellae bacterium]|nr:hypothetical protein [Kiritimatiellia bacterium]